MKLTTGLLVRSIAFQITLLLFGGLNVWTWVRHRYFPICCDQEISYGFPFPIHISGGIMGESDFYILGLLLDIAIALTSAVLVTWIVKMIRN